MSECGDIAIIGAGPYGLSIAAHLRAQGSYFRIFGRPMETWRSGMPSGMALKSEGFASTLYDPAGAFTLAAYCAQTGLPYAATGLPVPRATFAAYGMAFQRKFAPDLEPQDVVDLSEQDGVFHLALADGRVVQARRVVVAVGIGRFARLPAVLDGLPAELVSHGGTHAELDRFAGRDVTVVGAGASALDLAALLVAAGAKVRLVARTPSLKFHAPPGAPRSLAQRLRAPRSGLGTGWKSLACCTLPLMFRHLPAKLRHTIVARHLGPAGCWFTRAPVETAVERHLGRRIVAAVPDGQGRIRLRLDDATDIVTDHVIAATGYQVDLARLPFLEAGLRARIAGSGGAPRLSAHFETSVAGLYVVGAAASGTFGPLLRFACGAGFVARRLARALRA